MSCILVIPAFLCFLGRLKVHLQTVFHLQYIMKNTLFTSVDVSQLFLNRSSGPCTDHPYSNLKGKKPVDACGTCEQKKRQPLVPVFSGVIIKKQHMLCLIPFPMLRVNVLWTPIQRLATVTNSLNIGMLILITRQPVEMSDSLGSDYWTREQMETPHSFTLLLFHPTENWTYKR